MVQKEHCHCNSVAAAERSLFVSTNLRHLPRNAPKERGPHHGVTALSVFHSSPERKRLDGVLTVYTEVASGDEDPERWIDEQLRFLVKELRRNCAQIQFQRLSQSDFNFWQQAHCDLIEFRRV